MITVPVKRGNKIVVVIILEKENIDRMKEADPAILQFAEYKQLGFDISKCPSDQIEVVICYEEDIAPIVKFQGSADIQGLMRYLLRGYKDKPEDAAPITRIKAVKSKHEK